MTIHLSDVNSYKLLKTGQLTQYGGYLDDGFFEMGVAKEYIVHTLLQYSGHTHIILNAKDNPHDNNCVYDTRTKLMWSRYCALVVGPGNDGKLPWTTNVNGEGIFAYCAAANVALLAGYGDWRIPNNFELISLADYEFPLAVPDIIAFPGWPTADFFWTSTTYIADFTFAYDLSFSDGTGGIRIKTGTCFVSLVRGG